MADLLAGPDGDQVADAMRERAYGIARAHTGQAAA
jgi:hypothetical protein